MMTMRKFRVGVGATRVILEAWRGKNTIHKRAGVETAHIISHAHTAVWKDKEERGKD